MSFNRQLNSSAPSDIMNPTTLRCFNWSDTPIREEPDEHTGSTNAGDVAVAAYVLCGIQYAERGAPIRSSRPLRDFARRSTVPGLEQNLPNRRETREYNKLVPVGAGKQELLTGHGRAFRGLAQFRQFTSEEPRLFTCRTQQDSWQVNSLPKVNRQPGIFVFVGFQSVKINKARQEDIFTAIAQLDDDFIAEFFEFVTVFCKHGQTYGEPVSVLLMYEPVSLFAVQHRRGVDTCV